MGKDGALHNGIAQTISFPVNRNLANDVVWTVGYNTDTSGLHPLGAQPPRWTPERRTVARRADRSRPLPRLDHLGHAGRRPAQAAAVRRRVELNLDRRLGRVRAGCALHRSLTKTSPTGEVPPAMAARR